MLELLLGTFLFIVFLCGGAFLSVVAISAGMAVGERLLNGRR